MTTSPPVAQIKYSAVGRMRQKEELRRKEQAELRAQGKGEPAINGIIVLVTRVVVAAILLGGGLFLYSNLPSGQ